MALEAVWIQTADCSHEKSFALEKMFFFKCKHNKQQEFLENHHSDRSGWDPGLQPVNQEE